MDETTGVITITKYNGEKVIFDLNIEKIPVGFSMSDDGIITMTTEDGTQFTADIGSMIPVLTFEDSATIAVSVNGTGKNKTYSFSIKTGSVTDDMLQPNYLADIRVESANASAYAQSANAKSVLAESYAIGGTGTREGEDTDNAKYYMEQAKLQTGGIPTKVSELENDAGYITKSVSNLTNYYDKTDVDKKIDEIPKTDLTNYLTKTGDGSNLTAAFEEATTLEELTTGEKLSSIFGKLKLAVKNLKSLISLIGTTDISTIGDGTITGGLNDVNGKLPEYIDITAKCPASTWCNIPLPDAILSANRVIDVNRHADSDSNVYGVIWWPSADKQITILRINTNGTNLTIDNTAKTIKLRIWFC